MNADLFSGLMECGVKVYEEPYKYLHMKAYQVDGEYLNIGSFNQDMTSFYCNNESNMCIEGNKSCQNFFGNLFDRMKGESREVHSDEQYSTYGWVKSKWWRFFIEGTYAVMKNRDRPS